MKKLLITASLAACVLSTPALAAGDVVVVELFTAQGCAVCNPANQFLGELARESDVLALTWNVDVWNYLGWKDTLAAKSHTSRQEAYNAELANKSLSTPQFVVNGRRLVNGTQKLAVLNAVQQAGFGGELPLNVTFLGAGNKFRARLAGDAREAGTYAYLVWTRSVAAVDVTQGENAGKKLTFSNAVVGFQKIGEWAGGVVEVPISLSEGDRLGADGVAILIQDGEGGPLHGAGAIALAGVRP